MHKAVNIFTPRSICKEAELLTLLVDTFFLLLSVIGLLLNIIVWISLAQRLHMKHTKRFQEIRRSFNKGYAYLRSRNHGLKTISSSKSLKVKIKQHEILDDDTINSPKAAFNRNSIELLRSPSCPDVLLSEISSKEYTTDSNGIHNVSPLKLFGNSKRISPPQQKLHLKTAIYLVYCLNIADIISATTSIMRLLISLSWPWKNHHFIENLAPQIGPSWPCTKLFLSCLKFTAYNAAQLSIAGLVFDMYLGIAHPIHCHRSHGKNVLKCIITGWIIALLFGSNQLIMPSYVGTEQNISNKTLTLSVKVSRHFLLPSEPCIESIAFAEVTTRSFCYSHGSGNMYRSGFITGGLVLGSTIFINVVFVIALQKLKQQANIRTPIGKERFSQNRCTSLPAINQHNGVIFSLNRIKMKPPFCDPIRFTSRQLLRNFVALITLIILFLLLYSPSLVLEIFILVSQTAEFKQTGQTRLRFPPWLFNLISNLPVMCCIVNPLVYSLRLNDVRLGYRILKTRIYTKGEMKPISDYFLNRKSQQSKISCPTGFRIPIMASTPIPNGRYQKNEPL